MKRLNPKRMLKWTDADVARFVKEALEKARANYKANLQVIDEEFKSFDEDRKSIENDSQELVLLMTVVSVWKTFGFHSRRLSRLFDTINEINAMLEDGTMTWADIQYKADELGYVCNNLSGRVIGVPDGSKKEMHEYFRRHK